MDINDKKRVEEQASGGRAPAIDGSEREQESTRASAAGAALDLVLIAGSVLVMIAAIYAPVLSGSLLRSVIGFFVILFAPGYAVVAALFPDRKDLSGFERGTISIILSVVAVSLAGFGLNFTSMGIRLDPLVAVIAVFTLACILIAGGRRIRLKPEDRYYVDFHGIAGEVYGELVAGTRLNKVLGILIILAVLACVAAVGYIATSPGNGEKFTNLYILGPDGKADNYPRNLVLGSNGSIIVGVDNHEGRDMPYELEFWMNNSSSGHDYSNNSFQFVLADNQTWTHALNFTPKDVGNLTLNFKLFDYAYNETRDGANPYRLCRLMINVTTRPLKAPAKNATG